MDMELLPGMVSEYLDGLVPPRPAEMLVMEAYAQETNFPIIGPASGYLCYQLARMIGARRIFELGSGYGYSTAWFAQAVQENGGDVVHHVVWDEKLSQQARGHLSKLGFGGLIHFHVAEAVAELRATPGPFDLIFNDIDKQGYPAALPVIADKLRPGGLLITDNLLWHGRIFDPADQSEATQGVRALTQLLTRDARWVTTVVPLRDGVMVAYKK
jgi:predicted O-methyltransferase YrrM